MIAELIERKKKIIIQRFKAEPEVQAKYPTIHRNSDVIFIFQTDYIQKVADTIKLSHPHAPTLELEFNVTAKVCNQSSSPLGDRRLCFSNQQRN